MKFIKFLISNSKPNGWAFCSMPVHDMAYSGGVECSTCEKCIFEYTAPTHRAAIMDRFLRINICLN